MSNDLCKVALVIPVHNRRETTLLALRSLERIDTTGLDVRVFIVDDGSTDGTSDAIRISFPEIVLVPGNGTLHYAAGTNRGIEVASKWNPEYFVLMNDDSVFHDQFLQRLIRTARTNPRSIVGALLLLWDEPHRAFQVCLRWKPMEGGWNIPTDLTVFDLPESAVEVECLVGNCVLVPAEAIRECGLMDEERFPHGWGDAQYFTRMRKKGWNLLLDPTAYVWCEPNTYPQPLHKLDLQQIANVLFIDQKHPANLKRQYIALRESAPSKLSGIIASFMYCLILGKKTVQYSFHRLSHSS